MTKNRLHKEIVISPENRDRRMTWAKRLKLFFILVSILLVFSYYKEIENGLKSPNWPAADGEGISSHLRTTHHKRSRISYTSVIEYTYHVESKTHTGHNLKFIDEHFKKSEAQKVVDDHPLGRILKVYYDPKNPAVSALETGLNISDAIFGGTVLFVFILTFLFLAFLCHHDYLKVRDSTLGERGYIIPMSPFKRTGSP